MVIENLIEHPERLGRQTLYDLRKITAEYPYYQPARVLLLQNLFLLHDPTFDDELRRAAIFLTDRKVLFNIVEAAHYGVKKKEDEEMPANDDRTAANRTNSLIDRFLNNIPEEEETARKKPTPANAKDDYMSYLLSIDAPVQEESTGTTDLIDEFLNKAGGKLTLQDVPEYLPEMKMANDNEEETEDNTVVTENMVNVYIRQKQYDKALSLMKKLQKTSKKKNPYSKDQERFLGKLIMIQQTFIK